MSDGMNRRKFLRVLGASGGGAVALSGCSTDSVEKLIPYLVPNEDQIPGIATYYASTCRDCPAGCGVHVRVREGRAVKVEGNPDHPINRGKLCARAQASLQGTYNPDRITGPMARNAAGELEPITWDEAIARVAERLGAADGSKVWFITGNEGGSFDQLVNEWLRALGSSGRMVFEPFGYEAVRYANRQVFGVDAIPAYQFADAEYILSFGADFLETWVSPVEYARGFSAAHGYRDGAMGRYVHIEPRMSMTAMSADEWIAPAPGSEGLIALAMAQVILSEGLGRPPRDVGRLRGVLDDYAPEDVAVRADVSAEIIRRLAGEFAARPSIALPGGMGTQHTDAHGTAAAVNILNYVAGNVGRTIVFGADVQAGGRSSYASIEAFVTAAAAGDVEVLFVHGANPAFATPSAGGRFGAAQQSAGFNVSFARFEDETTAAADLVLPDHDPYEQWNDYEPRAGIHSLVQPVMQPVFDTRQTGDVLIEVARRVGGGMVQGFVPARNDGTYKDYLQERWRELQHERRDRRPFDTFWREALQRGGIWSEAPRSTVRLAPSASEITPPAAGAAPEGQFTLIAYPSLALYDGRAANRPWLQELPDPVTKMTWGTWLEIHPDTAERLGLAEGDLVEITTGDGASLTVPAYLYPGLRHDVVAMPLGQGHTRYGRYATDRGVNAYGLLNQDPTAFGGVSHYQTVTLRPTGDHEYLAKTEGKRRQLGRGIAQAVTLAAMQQGEGHPFHIQHAAAVPEREERVLDDVAEAQKEATRYGPYAYDETKWGMAIDLSKCTGCSACVAACSAENNVPFVGEDQVRRGREMHWIRIERYFEGGQDGEPLETRFVPMLCQQCGNAPCEPVCPVFAAYRTPDGLNAQVYNRCVGTRYCSNNCPYKVRYFNWYDMSTPNDPDTFAWPEPMHWLLNPDVTVRSRGVMEKCTFCVQRIRGAQHEARLSGVPLADGDVVVACQQTCPADAIVFGNLNDPTSRVARTAADARGYHVLGGLNTKPSVTYLMKVRNVEEA